jgi:hypothetical protein
MVDPELLQVDHNHNNVTDKESQNLNDLKGVEKK